MRVLFIHGLVSSPQGTKARYLAERFQALTPAMNTGDFAACLEQQREAIASFQPDVVVGSSFGGAVLYSLLRSGVWRGPSLFLAQAALKLDPHASLPAGVPVLLVHGTGDDVIPIAHSRRLAATGDPGHVRLLEVDDGHRLLSLVESDRLAELIRELGA